MLGGGGGYHLRLHPNDVSILVYNVFLRLNNRSNERICIIAFLWTVFEMNTIFSLRLSLVAINNIFSFHIIIYDQLQDTRYRYKHLNIYLESFESTVKRTSLNLLP